MAKAAAENGRALHLGHRLAPAVINTWTNALATPLNGDRPVKPFERFDAVFTVRAIPCLPLWQACWPVGD
jgi:hypothetical protein